MTTRTVIDAITDPSGQPREGLSVYFHAPEGYAHVIASTDAGGVFRAELVPEVTYRVSVENAVIVSGVTFPAGTVLLVRAPAGEGDVAGVDALIGTVDASRPALLDHASATDDVMATLLERLGTAGLSVDLSDLLARYTTTNEGA